MENPWLAVILEGLASSRRSRGVYYCNGENWNGYTGVIESGKNFLPGIVWTLALHGTLLESPFYRQDSVTSCQASGGREEEF